MTDSKAAPATKSAAGPLALAAVISAALVIATAMLVPGIDDAARRPAVVGAVVAALLGLGTGLVKAKALQKPIPEDPAIARQDAMRIQALLLSDFVVQLVGLGIGIAILKLTDAKFPAVSGFGLADATVVMFNGIASAGILSRAIRNRTSDSAGVSPESSTDPSGSE
ncbi:MAG: hypothetical protein AAF196_17640 [Planctomycetota bacterium]